DEDVTTNNSERYTDNSLTEETVRKELEQEEDNRYQFSLNYINRFNDEGHQLTADLQAGKGKETQKGYINEELVFNVDDQNTDFQQEEIFTTEEEKEYLVQV